MASVIPSPACLAKIPNTNPSMMPADATGRICFIPCTNKFFDECKQSTLLTHPLYYCLYILSITVQRRFCLFLYLYADRVRVGWISASYRIVHKYGIVHEYE